MPDGAVRRPGHGTKADVLDPGARLQSLVAATGLVFGAPAPNKTQAVLAPAHPQETREKKRPVTPQTLVVASHGPYLALRKPDVLKTGRISSRNPA
jgi:hypothetical protein